MDFSPLPSRLVAALVLIIVPASVVALLVVHKVHIRSTNLSSLVVFFPPFYFSHGSDGLSGCTAGSPSAMRRSKQQFSPRVYLSCVGVWSLRVLFLQGAGAELGRTH